MICQFAAVTHAESAVSLRTICVCSSETHQKDRDTVFHVPLICLHPLYSHMQSSPCSHWLLSDLMGQIVEGRTTIKPAKVCLSVFLRCLRLVCFWYYNTLHEMEGQVSRFQQLQKLSDIWLDHICA